jgi:hypothetical protein
VILVAWIQLMCLFALSSVFGSMHQLHHIHHRFLLLTMIRLQDRLSLSQVIQVFQLRLLDFAVTLML